MLIVRSFEVSLVMSLIMPILSVPFNETRARYEFSEFASATHFTVTILSPNLAARLLAVLHVRLCTVIVPSDALNPTTLSPRIGVQHDARWSTHGHDDAGNGGNDDGEEDQGQLGGALFVVVHADHALLLGGERLDDRRLNDRNERHVGVRRDHDRADELGVELLRNDDGGGAVSRTDDADGGCVGKLEEDGCEAEGEEDTKLCRRAEYHQLGVREDRTEVDHRADADEEDEWEKLIGDARLIERAQGACLGMGDHAVNGRDHRLRCCGGAGEIDENRAEAHREEQRRFHVVLDGEIDEQTADHPHDNHTPVEVAEVCEQVSKAV